MATGTGYFCAFSQPTPGGDVLKCAWLPRHFISSSGDLLSHCPFPVCSWWISRTQATPWLAHPTCAVSIKYANVSRLQVDQFFHQCRRHLSQDSLVPGSRDTFWWKPASLTQLWRLTSQGFCLTSRFQSWLASARLATVPACTRSDDTEVPSWWSSQSSSTPICRHLFAALYHH